MKEATLKELGDVIAEAKRVAIRYRELTGKPLGITGEVAEYEAARLLGLRLQDARQPGYDAFGTGRYEGERIEIKGRCLPEDARTQRVGRIKLDYEWDSIILVTLDGNFEPVSIHKSGRKEIEEAIHRPGSKARNERGQLSIGVFRRMSKQVWPTKDGTSAP